MGQLVVKTPTSTQPQQNGWFCKYLPQQVEPPSKYHLVTHHRICGQNKHLKKDERDAPANLPRIFISSKARHQKQQSGALHSVTHH